MPRRTIFVRDDDLDAFEAIMDRPGWLHWAISMRKNYLCTCDKLPAPHQHLYTDEKSHVIKPNLPAGEEEDASTYLSADEMP